MSDMAQQTGDPSPLPSSPAAAAGAWSEGAPGPLLSGDTFLAVGEVQLAEARRAAPPQPRYRRSSALASWRRLQARAGHLLDLHVTRGHIPERLPPEGMARLRCLRAPSGMSFLCTISAWILQLYVLIKAWSLLAHGVPSECGRLQDWLLTYCIVLSMMVCCQLCSGFAMALFAWIGRHMRASKGEEGCEQMSPRLFHFVDEMMVIAWLSLVLFWTGNLISSWVGKNVYRLRCAYAFTGPPAPEILSLILLGELVQRQAECLICLEGEAEEGEAGGEEAQAKPWRALPCGHAFHQECLLEWLRRARRCPLCRLDLHLEYQRGPHAAAGATALVALRSATERS